MGEINSTVGQAGQIKMRKICDMVMDEGRVPKDLELSTLTLIYKRKGDPLDHKMDYK